MKMFLISGNESYSYRELLNTINNSDSYSPYFQDKNLFSFFTNLVMALVSDQPVTLVDADFSGLELSNLGIEKVNYKEEIIKPYFSTINDLIFSVKKSRSMISIFTSGTTGQPKIVTHSFENLSRAVKCGDRFTENVWGFAYNPTHMAGLQVFFQALENKNLLVNIFGFSRLEVYSLIKDNNITHISATPTFYRLLLPFTESYDSVTRITLGGEKSSDKLYESIRTIFPNAKITNVYASTEAGTLFASRGSDFQIPEAIRDKIKVENGELYIHSSLLGKSESLKLEDDFYPSGDLIEWIDENEGVFRFKSRKNELINVGGYKVNPSEVEDQIRAIEGIKDVYVYGKSNSVLGNVLCADAVKENDSNIAEVDIRNILKSVLQEFKIPRRVKFVESLATTRTGKMKRI